MDNQLEHFKEAWSIFCHYYGMKYRTLIKTLKSNQTIKL